MVGQDFPTYLKGPCHPVDTFNFFISLNGNETE